MDEVPLELHKLIFSVIFLLVAGLLNEFTLAYIHDLVGHTPLPDIVFKLIPEWEPASKIGDIIVMICAASLFILFFVHKHRWIVMQRSFFIIGVLYYMRIISLFFTQLPPPFTNFEERCEPQVAPENRTFGLYLWRFWKQTFHAGFQDMDDKILCGDLLFSGHTLIMVTCAWMIAYYLPIRFRLLGYILKFLSVIGMVCMIVSRGHYSVDVIFAYWLSIGVFVTYHSYAEIYIINERENAAITNWMIVRKLVAWLEAKKPPGKIENEFDVPYLHWVREKYHEFSRRNEYSNMDNPHSDVAILIDAEPELQGDQGQVNPGLHESA